MRVAIVGGGDIGRGWAALIAAAGWPVSLYDNSAAALRDAPGEIFARARRLVELHRAQAAATENGIKQFNVGRSLLQACSDADWIIEAIPEDIKAKQKLVETLEGVAPNARLISSSSSALTPTDLVARASRPERCMIVHPLNPPELIPLVEIVPGPATDNALVSVVKGWLQALGRFPVVVKKPVMGNVVGRISAALWREAVDLVLEGVIDIDDLDRAVSLGPALGWAAAGPHLSYHLGAGNEGVGGFFQHLLKTLESVWGDLATWTELEPERRRAFINKVEHAYGDRLSSIRIARDRRLAAILRGLEDAREAE
ncbi:MAG: 3-hydroxyacyl-CoA dehydrogenase NAD-binding domain-containing protein [Gemmatimonadetes bacterium]|nr:3-hydroxyacyl-CoA dehydrogenase NAD-binding domain-containing protein [Gemmatimonadota bacterium]